MDRNVFSDVCFSRRALVVFVVLIVLFGARAQSISDSIYSEPKEKEILRPVTSTWLAEIGTAHVSDTYLTPLHYSGMHFAIAYSRLQAMRFSPEKFVMQLDGAVSAANMLNPAGNAHMYDVSFDVSWSMMRRWHLPVKGLTAGVGGLTGLDVGMLYLARNGNNPVSAKADWSIGVAGYAAYGTSLFRIPVQLRYSMSLPVTGVFFSPDYGELYYEIYLGNDSGLAHMAWWGNHFRYDHHISAMLRFSGTTLTLGYHGTVLSSKANSIVTNKTSHLFSIGVTTEWLSLSPRLRFPDDIRVVSANY